MPRRYVRKSERGQKYTKEKLEEAVEKVRSGVFSGYEASVRYNIPRTTLMDHVSGRHGHKSQSMGKPTALPPVVEKNLAENLHTMEKHGFGLSRKEVLEVVGEYVKSNNIKVPFKSGNPGEDWFTAFSRRNNLSLKKPQSVELARQKAKDPFVIKEYFALLKSTIDKLDLADKPQQIWNMDETSFCHDPSKTKIVGRKGFQCTRTTNTSGKRNTTVLLACSAAGQKAPVLIVFQGKYIWQNWTSKTNDNTCYAATANGWMEKDVFRNYFIKSFLKAIGNARPVLLTYDGHSTHIDLKVIEEAKKANVTILKSPPHSSHLLQPLDLSVMKSLKVSWDENLVRWQRMNIGTALPKKEFAYIISNTFDQLESSVIQNGFRKGGIYPFDDGVISDDKFDPDSLRRWKEGQNKNMENQNEDTNMVTRDDDCDSITPTTVNTIDDFEIAITTNHVNIRTFSSIEPAATTSFDKAQSPMALPIPEKEVILPLSSALPLLQEAPSPSTSAIPSTSADMLSPLLSTPMMPSISAPIIQNEVANTLSIPSTSNDVDMFSQPPLQKAPSPLPSISCMSTKSTTETPGREFVNSSPALRSWSNNSREVLSPLTLQKNNMTFEDLLLSRVRRADTTEPEKIKRKRITYGAEVITNEEVLERIRESERLTKEKLEKKKQIKAMKKEKLDKKKQIKAMNKEKLDKKKHIKPKNKEKLEKKKQVKGGKENKKLKKTMKSSPSSSSDESTVMSLHDSDASDYYINFEECQGVSDDENIIGDENEDPFLSIGSPDFIQNMMNSDSDSETMIFDKNPLLSVENAGAMRAVKNWVLVKFCTKKTVKLFVGQIIKIDNDEKPVVKFLRRKRKTELFYYPQVDDISSIYDEDIITLLPNPILSRRGEIKFLFDFSKFNVQ